MPVRRKELKAKPIVLRGQPVYVVNLSAKQTGAGRQRVYRPTEEAALEAARELLQEARAFGQDFTRVEVQEGMFLHKWSRREVHAAQMDEILEEWWKRKQLSARTIEVAVTDFLKAPRATPVDKRTASNLKGRLKLFVTAFRGRQIDDITIGEIDHFIKLREGSAPNFFRVVRQFYNYAELHGWLPVNPLRRLRAPAPPRVVKDVLTPEQLRTAIRIAAAVEGDLVRDQGNHPTGEAYVPLLRYLIFGGLCGLRSAEITRLDCADVDLSLGKHGEIHVRKMKTARRGMIERFVPLIPTASAWIKWLELPAKGRVIESDENMLSKYRRRLAIPLGLPAWPHNVLRRSFGSYHLAAFQDASLTAEIMGHTDAATTKAKYRVARRKEVAEQWFALTPKKVLAKEAVPSSPHPPAPESSPPSAVARRSPRS